MFVWWVVSCTCADITIVRRFPDVLVGKVVVVAALHIVFLSLSSVVVGRYCRGCWFCLEDKEEEEEEQEEQEAKSCCCGCRRLRRGGCPHFFFLLLRGL